MKMKLLFLMAVLLLAAADLSQAGGYCGRWGGGHWGGRGWYGGGGYWGGGPYWGWGGWGPSFGVGFVAPTPVYRTVYVAEPAPYYVTYARPALVRAQARLARLGYYPGPVDGDFGPGKPGTSRLSDRLRLAGHWSAGFPDSSEPRSLTRVSPESKNRVR
jgi:hypothetical protein